MVKENKEGIQQNKAELNLSFKMFKSDVERQEQIIKQIQDDYERRKKLVKEVSDVNA